MPLLSDDNIQAAGIHLLLIGATKTGKTRYITDMLNDGFHVIYIDNDNGHNTLKERLQGNKESMSRCYYISTQNIWDFCLYFFARMNFDWNLTKDMLYSAKSADSEDVILSLSRKNIPKGVVFVFDSWTSISLRLLNKAAEANGVSIEDFRDAGQAAYGSANRSANQMLMNLQAFQHHVVMQAHPDQYEVRENPPGLAKDSAKQVNQIIKANWAIPYSVSRPHGLSMGKFFSEIGWMGVNNVGHFVLDFKTTKDRVGGGSPQISGDPTKELRFSNAFLKAPSIAGFDWILERPASVILETEKVESTAKAAAKEIAGVKPAMTPVVTKPTSGLLRK